VYVTDTIVITLFNAVDAAFGRECRLDLYHLL
jgi:hypothetical protein